jgi:hypothetical protein
MATASTHATIEWPDWFDERAEVEMTWKGHLSGIPVRLSDGVRYEVNFITAGRLNRELELSTKQGEPYFAEQGLIVVPEMTLAAVQSVVERLADEGFFQLLKPLAPEPTR